MDKQTQAALNNFQMPRCIAITNEGHNCRRAVPNGNQRCMQHEKSYRGPLLEERHALKCIYGRDITALIKQRNQEAITQRMARHAEDMAGLNGDLEMVRLQREYERQEIRFAMQEDRLMLMGNHISQITFDTLAELYPRYANVPNRPSTIKKMIKSVRISQALTAGDYAVIRGVEIPNDQVIDERIRAARREELEDERWLRDLRDPVNRDNAMRHEVDDEPHGFEQMNFVNRWIRRGGWIVPENNRPEPAGELQRFASDAQNVHTSLIVDQTKETIKKICEIPVPEDYRWDVENCSKTPFEIGLECKLSQRAAWQMMSQYAQDTAIYDIEPGIYGKVLDSVWQYVKASPDKADMCRILKQEMEDNIGMCAQGNLSRLCNILAGYMDGVKQKESTAEILGRLFPKLMEMEDEDIRVSKAVKILVENNVPEKEWQTWIGPLRT